VIVRTDAHRLVSKEDRRVLFACLQLNGMELLGFPFLHPFGVLLPGPVEGLLHRVMPSSDMTLLTEDRDRVWPNWRWIISRRIDSAHSPTSKPCCSGVWPVTA